MPPRDLVKVSTSTTGTGTPLAVGSAETGFRSFAMAGIANGETISYSIEDSGVGRETCTGVYNSGAGTLTRTTRASSNASDAPLNLSGNAKIFVDFHAADIAVLALTDETIVMALIQGPI